MSIGAPAIPSVRNATLSGGETWTVADADKQFLDPGGSARTIVLPAAPAGSRVEVHNLADAAETITVNDDGADAVGTVAQNESKEFVSTGSAWIIGADIQAGIETHG